MQISINIWKNNQPPWLLQFSMVVGQTIPIFSDKTSIVLYQELCRSEIWTGYNKDSLSVLHSVWDLSWKEGDRSDSAAGSGYLPKVSSKTPLSGGWCWCRLEPSARNLCSLSSCLRFLVTWWLGSETECPQRTRHKLYHLLRPSLKVIYSSISSAWVTNSLRFKRRKYRSFLLIKKNVKREYRTLL